MNTKIIQKCLTELSKDAPDLSYVRGILETLIDMDAEPVISGDNRMFFSVPPTNTVNINDIVTDEDKAYARKMAGGPVAPLN
jgi:hypothetical protein